MELPKINQKIEFKVLHGPYASAYSTYVEDVEETALVVMHPMIGGNPVPLNQGEPIRVEYAVVGSARIAFETQVIRVDLRSIPVVALALPLADEVERYQQRDFVRLDVNLPLTYAVLQAPDDFVRPQGTMASRTRDVSGNGVQILTTEPLPPGTQLDIHMHVGDRLIHAVGEVIRQVAQVSAREFWMGVRFMGLDERSREVIIRYIFNEQRERRRRGLL